MASCTPHFLINTVPPESGVPVVFYDIMLILFEKRKLIDRTAGTRYKHYRLPVLVQETMNTDNKDIDEISHDHRHNERYCDEEKVDDFAQNFYIAHHGDNETLQELGTNSNCESNQNHHLESQISESSNHNELCCSVLTTVIDFVMMMPSDVFEPDEYEQNLLVSSTINASDCNTTEEHHKPPLLLVPVMRIIGPIIRRQKRIHSGMDCASTMDNHYLNRRPYQSACLYVHGAYPYMLARPTLAGLDGSCIPTNDCPWDSPIKVQQMIRTIHEFLENAVQETNQTFLNTCNDTHNAKSNDGNRANDINSNIISDLNNSRIVASNHPILRQITVLMGRGFYGYCSGPTAPFLRIEYYNPQDRWKVKRCLERGISFQTSSSMLCTPEFYFPKPRCRNKHRSEHDDIIHLDETSSILRFHCFEGHIPYTMQFFKDYNLAGMSHLHVSEPIRSTKVKFDENKDEEFLSSGPVLFRHPLPRSIRATKHQTTSDKCEIEIQSSGDFRPWVFLESNTSKEYRWDDALQPIVAKTMNSRSLSEKMTSCDVELDIHVSNIANQFDVMINLPSQYENHRRTHWRAVPSLHEIWKQERRRMSKLLPPQEDFLSHDDTNACKDKVKSNANGECCQVTTENNTPPFTLNVQDDRVVIPGAKLALDGMKKLVNVTSGLDDSFRRVMQQIVRRHAKSITETDLEILQRQTPLEKRGDTEKLTPSYDDTVLALDALGNLFNESTPTAPCVNCADDSFTTVKR